MKRPAFGHLLGYTALTVILTAGAAQSLAGSDTVFSDDITDGNVTSADIKDQGVLYADIKDGAMTGKKILDNSVTSADLQDGGINSVDLQDNGVGGADVANGSLSGVDIADFSLTGGDISDDSITGADVTPGREIVSHEHAVPANTSVPLVVSENCPSGKTITGGGYFRADTALVVVNSYPQGNGGGWTVEATNATANSINVQVRAICDAL